MRPVLSIIVPTYNMENYLRQNLNIYLGNAFSEALEVIIIDNSSDDLSGDIADEFASRDPKLFKVIHKENNGYGSSINLAILLAKGKYIRIVDADDWVEKDALKELITYLKDCNADLVETNYTIYHMKSGKRVSVNVLPDAAEYGKIYCNIEIALNPFPTMHSTTFRTEFLRNQHICLLNNTYYVDEQLMILTYMKARSIVYYSCNLYRYRFDNISQSVSYQNMGRRYLERERVIKSCIEAYLCNEKNGLSFNKCKEQISRNIGNHYTTLYMYVKPRKKGRKLADKWSIYLQKNVPELYVDVVKKTKILKLLNFFHTSLPMYNILKNFYYLLHRYNLA